MYIDMFKLNCIEFTIVSIVHLHKEFFAIAIVSTFVLMGKIFVYRIGGKLMVRSYAPIEISMDTHTTSIFHNTLFK
jgi:hypothetical protein